MSIDRIAHLGIAVKNWDEQVALYRDVLGLKLVCIEEIPDQQVRVAMFQVGESHIELLSPLSPSSPIAKFLEKHGEGIHHVAYATSGLEQALLDLDAKGVDLIDKTPRSGAHGAKIAFLHPRSTFGVLTEMCE
jgi:methylmalonyl-CoA/ethylmalonyl-CoA epimerase